MRLSLLHQRGLLAEGWARNLLAGAGAAAMLVFRALKRGLGALATIMANENSPYRALGYIEDGLSEKMSSDPAERAKYQQLLATVHEIKDFYEQAEHTSYSTRRAIIAAIAKAEQSGHEEGWTAMVKAFAQPLQTLVRLVGDPIAVLHKSGQILKAHPQEATQFLRERMAAGSGSPLEVDIMARYELIEQYQ